MGKSEAAMDELLQRGFVKQDSVIGPGGKEVYYKTTDAGREAVLEQPWK
jgi:DNA-binding PadR family transcriptional regulator